VGIFLTDYTPNLTKVWSRKGTGPKPEDFGDNFFLYEVATQCSFVEITFAQMQELFAAAPTHIALQAMAHSILVFASNVAKLLTEPPKGTEQRKNRAVRLQRILGCEEVDFSAIVSARNYLEHFDERMDRHLTAGHQGVLLHRIVSDSTAEYMSVEGWGNMKARYLQHLNTSTLELTMAGESIFLGPVVEQAVAIGVQAQAATRAGR